MNLILTWEIKDIKAWLGMTTTTYYYDDSKPNDEKDDRHINDIIKEKWVS